MDWFEEIESGLNTVESYNNQARSLSDRLTNFGKNPNESVMTTNISAARPKGGMPFGINLKNIKDPKTLFIYGVGAAVIIKVMR